MTPEEIIAKYTYNGKIVDVGGGRWMVSDEGRPPLKGTPVIVNGREAKVVADRYQMTARGRDKFLVVF